MAYDEELAARIRALVDDEPGLSVKRMFGGLAFLVHGNMAVAASGEGGLLLRADPERSAALVDDEHVQRAVMRGREMAGWLRVVDEAVRTEEQLARWVGVGVDYARTLPAK